MKLTDENLDYMDCRPLGRETGIRTPERIQKLIDQRKAERAAAANSENPPAPE